MKKLSRRAFAGSGAILATAFAAPSRAHSLAEEWGAAPSSPIRLGLASYTFQEFSRAQLISFMKELKVLDLNAKDVQDHLPMDRQ